MDPIFWLGLSILLVAVSIAAVLLAAVPAMKELGRAAQSAEKLFDTLNRELPPTLEAIRLTSLEITELTDDITGGAQSASNIVQQVDGSVGEVKSQAQQAKVTTKSVMAGMKAAWKSLTAEIPNSPELAQPVQSEPPSPIPLPVQQTPPQSQPLSSAIDQYQPLSHRTAAQPDLIQSEIQPEVMQPVIKSRLAGYENSGHLLTNLPANHSLAESLSDAEILLSNSIKPAESTIPVEE